MSADEEQVLTIIYFLVVTALCLSGIGALAILMYYRLTEPPQGLPHDEFIKWLDRKYPTTGDPVKKVDEPHIPWLG